MGEESAIRDQFTSRILGEWKGVNSKPSGSFAERLLQDNVPSIQIRKRKHSKANPPQGGNQHEKRTNIAGLHDELHKNTKTRM